MTALRKAAQQALEALDMETSGKHTEKAVHAMLALRAALAQEEREPVAWVNPNHLQGLTLGHYGHVEIYTDETQGRVPLYTAPPAAQRKPLTDEERRDLVKESGFDWHRGYVPLFEGDETNRFSVLIEAVERAHGIGGQDD